MDAADFLLFDTVNQPVFVLVADGSDAPVYKFINKVSRDYLGKSLDEVVGQSAADIFDGRAAESVYRHQCEAWAAGVSSEYEVAIPLRDATMWVRTRLIAVHDARGALSHMVGTSQDITRERKLMQSEAMTAAAAREMEDLVCLAAHDLRSPVGNLKSLADVLRKDFVDHGDGKLQLIDMIDAIADKALGVVSKIMVQAMATGAPISGEVFDLRALCDDMLVLLDPMGAHKVTYPDVQIEADYTVVHIILRNLLDNAVKHSGTGSATVSVTLRQMNAQRLQFIVWDDGPGFDAGIADDPAAAVTSEGFGLVGVRRLARSRGGSVNIVDGHGAPGAEVHFELPGQIVSEDADHLLWHAVG
ncbi:MAG: ATP-binding protein [Pseudomonadota bacterium]